MLFHLVVLKPFQGFKRGDVIRDTITVQRILSNAEASFVVRVTAEGI